MPSAGPQPQRFLRSNIVPSFERAWNQHTQHQISSVRQIQVFIFQQERSNCNSGRGTQLIIISSKLKLYYILKIFDIHIDIVKIQRNVNVTSVWVCVCDHYSIISKIYFNNNININKIRDEAHWRNWNCQFQLTINITISYFYCLVMIIMVIRLSYICMISIIIM